MRDSSQKDTCPRGKLTHGLRGVLGLLNGLGHINPSTAWSLTLAIPVPPVLQPRMMFWGEKVDCNHWIASEGSFTFGSCKLLSSEIPALWRVHEAGEGVSTRYVGLH